MFIAYAHGDIIYLDIAQFSYNLQWSESTGQTLFELATGQQIQTPHSLPPVFKVRSLGAYHMVKGFEGS